MASEDEARSIISGGRHLLSLNVLVHDYIGIDWTLVHEHSKKFEDFYDRRISKTMTWNMEVCSGKSIVIQKGSDYSSPPFCVKSG